MVMKKGFWSLLGTLMAVTFAFAASPAFATDDELGNAENNYMLYCASCHGREGNGKGALAETLEVPPRNHTDATKMSKRTDEQLFQTISEGGEATGFNSGMPPHNTILQKEDIRGLVKYLRKLCNCKFTS